MPSGTMSLSAFSVDLYGKFAGSSFFGLSSELERGDEKSIRPRRMPAKIFRFDLFIFFPFILSLFIHTFLISSHAIFE